MEVASLIKMNYSKITLLVLLIFGQMRLSADDIFEAIKEGQIEVVKSYIDNGLNLNKPDKFGVIPLRYAVKYQQIDIVKLLVENGANVHSRDNKNTTVMNDLNVYMNRSGEGRLKQRENLKKLGILESKIDESFPEFSNGVDFSDLGHEKWRIILEIIKPKFEQVPTSEKSIEVSQSLEELSPDLRAMDEHLSKGYDINVQNEDGVSMLMRAVEKQSPEMTAYLISKGINVDLRDINGLTAFDNIDKVPDDKVRQEILEIFSRLNDTKQPSLNVEPEPDLEAEPIH